MRTSVLVGLLLFACDPGSPRSTSDGGSTAPSPDAGFEGDGGSGQPHDAGAGDSGASSLDAGDTDGGSSPDAGLAPDGGVDVDGGAPDASVVTLDDLLGVWQVRGSDGRGAYEGEAELHPGPDGGVRFVRVIRYPGSSVEDGRELWWAWEGTATAGVMLHVALAARDFIASRGSLRRSGSEPPVGVSGQVRADATGLTVTHSGAGVAQTETWAQRRASSAAPIFQSQRVLRPTHAPPSPAERQNAFALYSSFHQLPDVQPYVSRPEFQAAVHGAWVDPTDFDFYRAHPGALRIVNKTVDPISQLETLQRANAYRRTLVQKATQLDDEVWTRFIVPTGVNMVPQALSATGQISPSTDAALWTGTYVASQAFRFQVTGNADARQRVAASLDALLTLQEITGDWTTFARALRPAGATPPAAPWHRGTGAFSHLEWKEGGNNDGMKGLQYGYAMGWKTLCDPVTTAYATLCNRLKVATQHLAEDLQVSQGTNSSTNYWLAAVVATDALAKLRFTARAELEWTNYKLVQGANVPLYQDGSADWSGLHLNVVEKVTKVTLSQALPLDRGTSTATLRSYIARDHATLRGDRLVLFHLLRGAFDPQGYTPADADDMRWRLREYRVPKIAYANDHRLNPTFCVSPYPSLPWKMDWTTTDRVQSLTWFPLFEDEADVYLWKVGRDIGDSGNLEETPSVDYLHAYWLARAHGLLSAQE